jgi:hypothetical protein
MARVLWRARSKCDTVVTLHLLRFGERLVLHVLRY